MFFLFTLAFHIKESKMLWRCPFATEINNILLTPLWCNETIRLPLKPLWLKKGITIKDDLLDDECSLMSSDDFQDIYNIKTNFLEYGGLMLTLKNFLDNQELPEHRPNRPTNSPINIILNKDTKGVSNLYKCMYTYIGQHLYEMVW